MLRRDIPVVPWDTTPVVGAVPGPPAVAAGVPGAVGSLVAVGVAARFLRPNHPRLRGAAPLVAYTRHTFHSGAMPAR